MLGAGAHCVILQPSDPQQPPGAPGPTKVDLGPEGDEQGVLSGLQ